MLGVAGLKGGNSHSGWLTWVSKGRRRLLLEEGKEIATLTPFLSPWPPTLKPKHLLLWKPRSLMLREEALQPSLPKYSHWTPIAEPPRAHFNRVPIFSSISCRSALISGPI